VRHQDPGVEVRRRISFEATNLNGSSPYDGKVKKPHFSLREKWGTRAVVHIAVGAAMVPWRGTARSNNLQISFSAEELSKK
jgi:hypothetical protein